MYIYQAEKSKTIEVGKLADVNKKLEKELDASKKKLEDNASRPFRKTIADLKQEVGSKNLEIAQLKSRISEEERRKEAAKAKYTDDSTAGDKVKSLLNRILADLESACAKPSISQGTKVEETELANTHAKPSSSGETREDKKIPENGDLAKETRSLPADAVQLDSLPKVVVTTASGNEKVIDQQTPVKDSRPSAQQEKVQPTIAESEASSPEAGAQPSCECRHEIRRMENAILRASRYHGQSVRGFPGALRKILGESKMTKSRSRKAHRQTKLSKQDLRGHLIRSILKSTPKKRPETKSSLKGKEINKQSEQTQIIRALIDSWKSQGNLMAVTGPDPNQSSLEAFNRVVQKVFSRSRAEIEFMLQNYDDLQEALEELREQVVDLQQQNANLESQQYRSRDSTPESQDSRPQTPPPTLWQPYNRLEAENQRLNERLTKKDTRHKEQRAEIRKLKARLQAQPQPSAADVPLPTIEESEPVITQVANTTTHAQQDKHDRAESDEAKAKAEAETEAKQGDGKGEDDPIRLQQAEYQSLVADTPWPTSLERERAVAEAAKRTTTHAPKTKPDEAKPADAKAKTKAGDDDTTPNPATRSPSRQPSSPSSSSSSPLSSPPTSAVVSSPPSSLPSPVSPLDLGPPPLCPRSDLPPLPPSRSASPPVVVAQPAAPAPAPARRREVSKDRKYKHPTVVDDDDSDGIL